jgi:hypothetical protein
MPTDNLIAGMPFTLLRREGPTSPWMLVVNIKLHAGYPFGCRDALRTIAVGGSHLSKDARGAAHHVAKVLCCAALDARADLWKAVEQVCSHLRLYDCADANHVEKYLCCAALRADL